MWVFFGLASVAFTVLSGILAYRDNEAAQISAYGAIGCTALTVMKCYSAVADWVIAGDISALEDVVPTMANILRIYVIALLGINLLVVLYFRKKKE